MKNILYFLIIVFLALTGTNNTAQAQDSGSITAGLGYYDLMNIGVKLRDNQVQYGFTIGTLPTGNYFTLSGDLYFHIEGNSKHTELRPLYIKTGLTYNKERSPSFNHKSVLLNLRIGREFNFTTRFGCNLDAGAFIYLSNKSEDKFRNQTLSSNKTVIQPGGSFNIFYRF